MNVDARSCELFNRRNMIVVDRVEYIDANFRAAVSWPVDFYADNLNDAHPKTPSQVSAHVDNLWTF